MDSEGVDREPLLLTTRKVAVMRRKQCLAVISVCCFGSLLPFVSFAQARVTQVVTQGRFGGDVNGSTGLGTLPLLFSWPASSVYASFVSDSVSISLSALPATMTYDVDSRFAFYLDDELMAVETTFPRHTSLRWNASGLGEGKLHI